MRSRFLLNLLLRTSSALRAKQDLARPVNAVSVAGRVRSWTIASRSAWRCLRKQIRSAQGYVKTAAPGKYGNMLETEGIDTRKWERDLRLMLA